MSKRNAILRPLGLAMILTLGFSFIISLPAEWINATIDSEKQAKKMWDNEEVKILRDGRQVIYHSTFSMKNGVNIHEYLSFDRKKLNLSSEEIQNPLFGATLAGPNTFEKVQWPTEDYYRARNIGDGWYFILNGNCGDKGYLVGYDAKFNYCIGYIGRSGYSKNIPASDDWFPIDWRKLVDVRLLGSTYGNSFTLARNESYLVMISGNQLLKIDLQSKLVTTLRESSDMIFIVSVPVSENSEASSLSKNNPKYNFILRTLNSVVFLDDAGKEVQKFVIPEELRTEDFEFIYLGEDKAMLRSEKRMGRIVDCQLTWIDAKGNVQRKEQVLLLGWELQPSIPQESFWELTLGFPAPIATALFMFRITPMDYLRLENAPDYVAALNRSLSDWWPMLVVLCVLAVVLASFCYRRQRRMALPWTWIWVVFVFLFGVSGFLGYLFHRRWPVLDNCQVCGHSVPHDREKCSSCGSDFPAPAPMGIEVFA
jgi:hypothetical protein